MDFLIMLASFLVPAALLIWALYPRQIRIDRRRGPRNVDVRRRLGR